MDQYNELLHRAALEDGNPKQRYSHMSVRVGNVAIVFGGSYCGWIIPLDHVLVIDPTIKKLEVFKIPFGPIPHKRLGACVCAIGTEIFMHGGFVAHDWTDELWKLWQLTPGQVVWERVDIQGRASKPSPRSLHSGCAYDAMFWRFGRIGPFSEDYMNRYGEMIPTMSDKSYLNNQLFSYDSTERRWRGAHCDGNTPPPCYHHATAIICDTVWMYGGATVAQKELKILLGLYSLNMDSLQWTLVSLGRISVPPEQTYMAHTFTAVDDHSIVLFGGTSRMVWEWNIVTRSWHFLMELKQDFAFHTAVHYSYNSLLIFGGALGENDSTFMFILSLFPKPYLRNIDVHEAQLVDPLTSHYQVPVTHQHAGVVHSQ